MPTVDTRLPLAGLNLLITRPQAQAEVWARQLQPLGVNTTLVPVLAIVPLTDSAAVQAIKNCLYDFDLYSKVIFVSQNAVHYGMNWVDDLWPQYPVEQQYFAVGAATAAALIERGIAASAAADAMNSEALLALPQLQHVAGERILIMRGCGGRTHLGDVLSERGARVDYLELYERQLPVAAEQGLREWLAAQHGSSLVSVHSGESLENLNQLIDAELMALKKMPLLVPGERVATLARAAGWQVIVADNATHPAMLSAMRGWYQHI